MEKGVVLEYDRGVIRLSDIFETRSQPLWLLVLLSSIITTAVNIYKFASPAQPLDLGHSNVPYSLLCQPMFQRLLPFFHS